MFRLWNRFTKGKIERPYGWLQDRLVRTCARENVTDIKQDQIILNGEMNRYNYRQVHSTTGKIPAKRFQRTTIEKLSLFREFSHLLSQQKIFFAWDLIESSDAYRKISIDNIHLKVNNLDPHEHLNLRIYPLYSVYSKVRFWANNKLLDAQKLKNDVFKSVHF